MKKQFILFALLLLSTSLFAQFEKGDKVLGGSAMFNRSDDGDNGVGTVFSITPRFGRLMNSKLELGVEMGWSTSRVKSENSKFTSNTFSPGLYVARYFELTDKFFFRIGASGLYSQTKEKQRVSGRFGVFEDEQNASQMGVFVSPGFVFFPNRHWGFGATIGNVYYTRMKVRESGDTQSDLGLSAGSLVLNFAYYFRKSAD